MDRYYICEFFIDRAICCEDKEGTNDALERQAKRKGKSCLEIEDNDEPNKDEINYVASWLCDFPLAWQVHFSAYVWAKGRSGLYCCRYYDDDSERWYEGCESRFLRNVHIVISIDCSTFADRAGNMAWGAFHAFLNKLEKKMEKNYCKKCGNGYWNPRPVCEP